MGTVAVLAACHAPARDPASALHPMSIETDEKAGALILAIAHDLEELRASCPNLADFDVARHADVTTARIEYGHHTHTSTRRGGWASAVPNPDPDGVWLYIDVHDATSSAQIHTQPVVPMNDLGGGKRLMMLLLEGSSAPPCAAKIRAILDHRSAGVRF